MHIECVCVRELTQCAFVYIHCTCTHVVLPFCPLHVCRYACVHRCSVNITQPLLYVYYNKMYVHMCSVKFTYLHMCVDVEVVKRARLLHQWTGEWEEEGVCLWVEFGSSDLLMYLNHCPLPRPAPMNLNEINTRSCD